MVSKLPCSKEFVEHYQEPRPQQGLDQRTPSGQPAVTLLAEGRIARQDRLGGLVPRIRPSNRMTWNQGFLTAHARVRGRVAPLRATADN
jgi:hypothetical protein